MGIFEKQKEEERDILDLFVKEYNPSIEILSFQQAKKVFPEYNQDNPDFVIKFRNEFFGIELFRLIPDKYDTGEKGIINNAHHAKVSKGFVEVPPLTDASIGQINKKMSKIINYVTPKIWLLGYAKEYYNAFALKPAIEDRFLRQYVNGILNNISVNPRVEKIFLFEIMSHILLIDILDPSSYEIFCKSISPPPFS